MTNFTERLIEKAIDLYGGDIYDYNFGRIVRLCIAETAMEILQKLEDIGNENGMGYYIPSISESRTLISVGEFQDYLQEIIEQTN